MLIAFTIVVLGGMGSVAGRAGRRSAHRRGRKPVRPAVSARSLGQIGIFVMFILVLLLRPSGLFGDARMKALVANRGRHRRARRGAARRVISNVMLNFLVVALLIALVGQGWNVLGGYGGQYSFGHAAFFGTGAYVTAILQVRYGVNAWLAFALGIAAGAAARRRRSAHLTFRSGLRGSYFALVTLAFAEVLRIIASVAPVTGAGVGTLIRLDLRPRSVPVPEPRRVLLGRSWRWSRVSLVIATDSSDRGSAPGWSRCARTRMRRTALGVDTARVKLAAMTISARHHRRRPACFYAQYFLFVDSGHRLRHLDLDRGAADADHRRRRHRVRPAARRAGCQVAGRGR